MESVTQVDYNSSNMNIDAETLIHYVSQCPSLWNFNSKEYRKANIRDTCWIQIGLKLNVPPDECAKRWSQLRENYRREKRKRKVDDFKSGNGKITRKGFPHFEKMQFLKSCNKIKKTFTNVQIEPISQPTIPGDTVGLIAEKSNDANKLLNVVIKSEPPTMDLDNFLAEDNATNSKSMQESSPSPSTSTSKSMQESSPSPSTSTSTSSGNQINSSSSRNVLFSPWIKKVRDSGNKAESSENEPKVCYSKDTNKKKKFDSFEMSIINFSEHFLKKMEEDSKYQREKDEKERKEKEEKEKKEIEMREKRKAEEQEKKEERKRKGCEEKSNLATHSEQEFANFIASELLNMTEEERRIKKKRIVQVIYE